jgi:G:T-mismatch repair DNA endonuclease (very short patch repair protein)
MLRHLGWHVVTIWERALKKKSGHPWIVVCLPVLLGRTEGV